MILYSRGSIVSYLPRLVNDNTAKFENLEAENIIQKCPRTGEYYLISTTISTKKSKIVSTTRHF